MKYYLFTFITFYVVFSSLSAQDQPYLPTAVEGATWIIQDSETPHFPYISFVRRIEGDTVVGGRTYKKLYQQVIDHIRDESTDPPLASPYEVFPERELIALLRDSIAARSVYGMARNTFNESPEFSPDALLHDYSLAVGDTLVGANFMNYSFDVMVIDETGIEDRFGGPRPYQAYFVERFYEGVGSWEFGPTSGGSSLEVACCINRLIDYCVGDLESCQVWLTPVTNLTPDLTIKTHPNPFTSTLNFTTPDSRPNDPVTVSLHDLSGCLLRSGKLEGGLEWTTEDLPAGMYLVTFISGGKRGTVKVVKQ